MNSGSPAQTRFALAKAWHSKGNAAAAILGYRAALLFDAGHVDAALNLGAVLSENQRLAEAIEVYRKAVEEHPGESRLHKGFVQAAFAGNNAEEVFRFYGMSRKDVNPIDLRPEEILCCVVLRNEFARLPYFLEYYRGKGIGTFFAFDNGSTDGSLEYLLAQPDVHVWQSEQSFKQGNFGAAWFEPVLRQYGRGHWCLIVDADELLYYHGCERTSLPALCRQLDKKGKRALNAVLLDMYSDLPLEETVYTPGERFEDCCSYFDREFYHTRFPEAGPYRNQTCYFGGVRQRVFGDTGGYILSKVPLIRYDEDCLLAAGQHWTNLPVCEIATETGCLLHFKYFSSFPDFVVQETCRHKDYGAAPSFAIQYQEYRQRLNENRALSFYDPSHSVRLEGSEQLLQLGILQPDEEQPVPVVFPHIDPVFGNEQRPFWSVMLTAYRRTDFLEQALRSVLAQASGPDEMQIEVVSDGPDHPAQQEIERIVQSMAGGRINFYRHPDRAGHPEIFNICIRRARGLWIHVLHDDDWVAPGFYEALRRGIDDTPAAGAAFCRHNYVDEKGRHLRSSPLERETPGVVENWLELIGSSCRLQTPSIVVRREAYELLGGYCPQAKSAFDWEMWQRLSVHYPVWYEPKALAYFRQSCFSESNRLIASGEQIADTRDAIEIAQAYLPSALKDRVARAAGEHYALAALEYAKLQLEAGDFQAAIANIGEGLRCSQSEETKHRLISLFLRRR